MGVGVTISCRGAGHFGVVAVAVVVVVVVAVVIVIVHSAVVVAAVVAVVVLPVFTPQPLSSSSAWPWWSLSLE